MTSNGVVLYEGPSLLNGKAIVVIAIGFKTASSNAKTGGMIQTYFLNADENPMNAVKNGTDACICGGCIHRRNPLTGLRTCYVRIDTGPNNVYKAWKRGNYPVISDYAMFANRPVRLGTYGDPAAAPVHILRAISAYAKMTTGYTHQWRSKRFANLSYFCQASTETAEDVAKANAKGFGTFRVLPVLEPIPANAIHCPASAERGHLTTCVECGVCDGASQRNVAILAHGSTGHKYTGTRTNI
jgi:hypothetical protein